MSYSHRELKIDPTAQCPPVFESLKRPSEKAGWPRVLNLEGTISDNRVLGQPHGLKEVSVLAISFAVFGLGWGIDL